jgi:2-keto-4-pentenoate hydratase/2-oxohepta-3-ene-1,7-dioic acid hydratase in catechol pathway
MCGLKGAVCAFYVNRKSRGKALSVALGMKPEPKFLKAGDVVTLGIEGLGEQKQKIAGERK